MIKSLSVVVLTIVAVFTTCFQLEAQQKRRTQRPIPPIRGEVSKSVDIQANQVREQMITNIFDPGSLQFSVDVYPGLSLSPQQQGLYQALATSIGTYTNVPQDRAIFYSGVSGFALVQWDGFVTDVATIPHGYLVTVAVTPGLVTSEGTPVSLLAEYYEQFRLIDGVASYVGFVDPNNQSGSVFATFEY